MADLSKIEMHCDLDGICKRKASLIITAVCDKGGCSHARPSEHAWAP